MSSSARFHIRNQTKYKQQVSLDPPGGSHHFQFMVEPNQVMALNQSSVPPGTKISVIPPPTTDLQWNTPILNGQVRGASITITLKIDEGWVYNAGDLGFSHASFPVNPNLPLYAADINLHRGHHVQLRR
ncbi:unnamed protein product [Durusdinium trenchii]|uniref:Uncharacterized protein n=1 Tax=Durusdinium trenchii TaxID=1381693 RepID=A0ABP0MPM0_9DINO